MNLTLHLTDNCNMDCSYCIREKCPKDMTEDVLIAACDLAFSRGQRAGLCFFGGEPLLKKDLIYKALAHSTAKPRISAGSSRAASPHHPLLKRKQNFS